VNYYPTMEQVEKADRQQLAFWVRFLPSPGGSAIGYKNFNETLEKEVEILNRILERFDESGGWTPSLSKSIGLGE
jgi:hypothetical protein